VSSFGVGMEVRLLFVRFLEVAASAEIEKRLAEMPFYIMRQPMLSYISGADVT